MRYFFLVLELELLIRKGDDIHREDEIRDALDWIYYRVTPTMRDLAHEIVEMHMRSLR